MENESGFSFNTVIADYIQTSENNWYMLEVKDFELKENVIRNKKSIVIISFIYYRKY